MSAHSYIRAVIERPDAEMYVGLPACTALQAAQRRLAAAVARLPVCDDVLQVVGGHVRPTGRSVETLLRMLGIDVGRAVFSNIAAVAPPLARFPRGVPAPGHVRRLMARGAREAGEDVELLSYVAAMNAGCRRRFMQVCQGAGVPPALAGRMLRVLVGVMTQALHRHCAAGLPALSHLPEFY